MSEYVTKQDVQTIVDKAVTDLSEVIAGFAQQVDQRFNKVEADIAVMQHDIVDIKSDVAELNKKYDHLISTIDTFLARIDAYETEQAARDSQFQRLLAWARKVSEKTGIPLENL